MAILVKTTGAFIIPLGRGEFVLPEPTEVEDCALLRDEIARGRAVIVEVAKPEAEPEQAVEAEAPVQKRNRRK